MGMQKEPGKKGVNWSNIAVGAYTSFALPDPAKPNTRDRCNHEHGTIVSYSLLSKTNHAMIRFQFDSL
jgi:hypothetical protein